MVRRCCGSREMERTILSLLHNKKSRVHLSEIHAKVIRCGLHDLNSVLSHFVSVCGSLHNMPYAEKVFLLAGFPDIYLFNAMIKGYSLSGPFGHSFSLFSIMKRRGIYGDRYTYAPLLKACANFGDIRVSRSVHKDVFVNGFEWITPVRIGVVEMYVSHGFMDDARMLFDEMFEEEVIIWNLIIHGYCQAGKVDVGLRLFRKMNDRTVVSWNIMIGGLGECGRDQEALELFDEMQIASCKPDEATVITLLPICARLGAVKVGDSISSFAESSGLKKNIVPVGNALVQYYGKCGRIDAALKVFDEMPRKTVISWNTMISCLAFHGKDELGIKFFEQMVEEGSSTPNGSSFVGVLTCCSHSGMIERGKEFFNLMSTSFQIEPKIEHYGCMVDLLGRGGHVHEAYDLVRSMRVNPNSSIWGSLLSACRIHGELEIAKVAATELIRLEPWNSGHYVLLSNMYAEEQKWDEVEMIRLKMKEKGITKVSGRSAMA